MHDSMEAWQDYVADRMTDQERAYAEEHLEGCDHCLELYMACLMNAEETNSWVPSGDEVAFTDQIMSAIADLPSHDASTSQQAQVISFQEAHAEKEARVSKESWLSKTIVHYSAAAAITIALMATGIFDRMPENARKLETTPIQKEETVSGKLMEKTVLLLDSLQPKETGGNTRVP